MDHFYQGLATKIENRYDPESDVPPVGPEVTWTDRSLLDIILHLDKRLRRAESLLEQVQARFGTYDTHGNFVGWTSGT